MATNTTNYNLVKPSKEDFYDVGVNNSNMDTLDALLFALNKDKVDKITGKGLSENDFTTMLKDKLEGIAEGATKYKHPLKHPPEIIEQDLNNRFISDFKLAQIENNKRDLGSHKLEKISEGETHGIRVNDSTNKFEYFNGKDWVGIEIDEASIRDNSNLNLRLRVSDVAPAAIDGRVYYNSVDMLFYVARNGQWWRLYVGGDEKLEQTAPVTAPALETKTDTTIKLVAENDKEYMYNGGDWQESSLFTGLNRNAGYTLYSRIKETEIYKASPASPALSVTTEKGTQTAPSAPTISNIKFDRATITGASGTEVRLGSGTWHNTPHTFTGLTEVTSYTAYARRKETSTHLASPISGGRVFKTESDSDDKTGSPGPKKLIAGTMQEGFFGEVPSSQLITGDTLASQVGISQGTSQHSGTEWLKFAWKGDIIFIAKKPIRHSISWDAINTAKCVYGDSGDKTVIIGGKTYKVTLMRALNATNDPKTVASANGGEVNHGSQWNKLMCQIHEQAIDKSWDYPVNIESGIGKLTHSLGNGNQGMYNDSDLVVKSGNGRLSWCQEMGTSTSGRLSRGYGGVSSSNSDTSSNTNGIYGWRPSLELVP